MHFWSKISYYFHDIQGILYYVTKHLISNVCRFEKIGKSFIQ